MRTLLGLLRSWRMLPVVGLVALAGTGVVTHLMPSEQPAGQQTTAAAAPAAGGGGGPVGGQPASGGDGLVAGTNPKSRPMQESGPLGTGQLPAPSAAVYDAQTYHTPTATSAWTGQPDPAVHTLIVKYFPAGEVAHADQVSLCESGQRSVVSAPNSNGSRDRGVFQLNDAGTLQHLLGELGEDPTNLDLALNPEINVRAAALLYSQRGWQPWTCAAKLGIVAGLWSSDPGPNG